jgi:NADH dehydrogenase
VWTAGVDGQQYLKEIGGETTPDSRLKITKTLNPQSIDAPNVFVVGDSCAYEYKGKFLPPVAPLAMQQGVMAVKNIMRMIKGKAPIDFTYLHFGYLVSLGKNNSVVNLFGIKMRGALAYYIWKMTYLYKIGMFKKQVAVFFDWVMSFFFGNESVLIIDQDNCTNCILQKNHKKPSKKIPL